MSHRNSIAVSFTVLGFIFRLDLEGIARTRQYLSLMHCQHGAGICGVLRRTFRINNGVAQWRKGRVVSKSQSFPLTMNVRARYLHHRRLPEISEWSIQVGDSATGIMRIIHEIIHTSSPLALCLSLPTTLLTQTELSPGLPTIQTKTTISRIPELTRLRISLLRYITSACIEATQCMHVTTASWVLSLNSMPRPLQS